MADLLSVPGGTGKQASLELVKRLGTEGPLPLEREFQRHVRWLNQESARALAHAECQSPIEWFLIEHARRVMAHYLAQESAYCLQCGKTSWEGEWVHKEGDTAACCPGCGAVLDPDALPF
jgi:hypothetical protein